MGEAGAADGLEASEELSIGPRCRYDASMPYYASQSFALSTRFTAARTIHALPTTAIYFRGREARAAHDIFCPLRRERMITAVRR